MTTKTHTMKLKNSTPSDVYPDLEGDIEMSAKEAAEFKALTGAAWTPRTNLEFNAFCDLAIARHLADSRLGIDRLGHAHAVAVGLIKIGPNGEINFPISSEEDEYRKKYGVTPSPEQLAEFVSSQRAARPNLRLVR